MEQELDKEDEQIGETNSGGHGEIGLPIGAYLGLVTPGSAPCVANGFPERSQQSRGRRGRWTLGRNPVADKFGRTNGDDVQGGEPTEGE